MVFSHTQKESWQIGLRIPNKTLNSCAFWAGKLPYKIPPFVVKNRRGLVGRDEICPEAGDFGGRNKNYSPLQFNTAKSGGLHRYVTLSPEGNDDS